MATASNSAQQKRLTEGRIVPEPVQQPMRERLRMLRISRGVRISEIEGLSPGTVTNFELHDITTMQVWHVWSLAAALGIDFAEFATYLFGEEGSDSTLFSERAERMNQMMRLMQIMSEDDQRLAVNLIDQLVDGRVQHIASGFKRPYKPRKDVEHG